ncbi:MAG TPA: amino acid adenylation domain-containing protein [Longimicrobiaceae bacterium]|nr:amino acid adenylation domain-containing protein [Longimicrobiaceae bacterium]
MSELLDRLAALSPAKRALLESAAGGDAAGGVPPAPDGPAPLSFEQRRLWHQLQLAPDLPVYTIPCSLRLRGRLHHGALEDALRELVARHEPLRTAYRETDSEQVQVVGDGSGFALEAGALAAGTSAEAAATAFIREPFALGCGIALRARLLRLGDDDHRLLLALHHLSGDGWSLAVLLRELGELYAARLAGRRAMLPALPIRFRDWAALQRRRGEGSWAADLAYWRERVAGAPHVLEVPPDRPRPPLQSWRGAKHGFSVDAPLAEALRALARSEGTTLYAVLAAAFALTLGRYAREDDFLLGTALANRPLPQLEEVAGFFANTLPLRMRLGGDPTVRELLRRTHAVAAGAHAHGGLPFDRIVSLAGVRRDPGRPPLVQAVLVHNRTLGLSLALPGVAAEVELVDSGTSPFDLTLLVDDRGDVLAAELQHADLYEPATIGWMARHLAAVLAAFAADPDRAVSRVRLATADEVRAVAEWNRTAHPLPGDGLCIHQLFERHAAAAPERTAVVHAGGSLTYGELDRRAGRIAGALRRLGAGPEQRVAVCMERTPAVLAAVLGVLKAGAAYVPLDASHPPARQQAVLRGSGARLVVADAAGRATLPPLAEGVRLVDPAALEDGDAASALPATVWPGNLAYVIFTSGSTGGPKGVEVEHRCAVSMLHHCAAELLDRGGGPMLAATSLTFDFSVVEVFGALCSGRTVVLVDDALSPVPPGCEVGSACLVPTAAAELLRGGALPAGIGTVVVGGEAVPPALVDALFAAPPVQRVVTVYGPTEICAYCTSAELTPGLERIPIGAPIADYRVYVLDEGLAHAGIAVPGEIWVGGAGVARGYAGRPALTAARFRPDPYGPPGARMYRTLDLGRWRDNGQLEFLGRADAQVKVRGFRIELAEVEQALAAHPAVAEAAAGAHEDGAGGRLLCAWLVAREGMDPVVPAELRAHLRATLPDYMVPTAFAWTAALPRTATGKLDRRALPRPDADAGTLAVRHVGPRSALEERLARIWSEVLGVERVGVHDDFFDLGGESILATRLMARVRTELGARVPVAELLRGPTVEQLARAVAGQPREARLPLVPLQPQGQGPPLFLGHPGGGHVVCYRTLAGLLAPEHPVYGLQAQGIDDGRGPLGSVEEMAAYYLRGVRALQPAGPYHLGGWSFGGILGWEMAQQLAAAGEEVALLALLDTGMPRPAEQAGDALDHARVLQRIVADLVGWAAAALVKVEKIRGLSPREQALAAIRQVASPRTLPESRLDEVLALTAVRLANLRALVGYRARPYPGHATYFRTAGSERMHPPEPGHAFWRPLALGGMTVHRLTGSHGTILHQPHVAALAGHLAASLAAPQSARA